MSLEKQWSTYKYRPGDFCDRRIGCAEFQLKFCTVTDKLYTDLIQFLKVILLDDIHQFYRILRIRSIAGSSDSPGSQGTVMHHIPEYAVSFFFQQQFLVVIPAFTNIIVSSEF